MDSAIGGWTAAETNLAGKEAPGRYLSAEGSSAAETNRRQGAAAIRRQPVGAPPQALAE